MKKILLTMIIAVLLIGCSAKESNQFKGRLAKVGSAFKDNRHYNSRYNMDAYNRAVELSIEKGTPIPEMDDYKWMPDDH